MKLKEYFKLIYWVFKYNVWEKQQKFKEKEE